MLFETSIAVFEKLFLKGKKYEDGL